MKRILALILVVLTIFALVGCTKDNKRQIVEVTLSTEDAEAILAAAGITLPAAEDVAAAGSEIVWFAWFDSFHNYDEAEVVNTGFWTFKEKYGCSIEWIECEWGRRFDDLANLILAGTAPDFYPGDCETFPYYAIKGMFQPVDDYIDYNDPLWSGVKDYADTYFSLGGDHYMIITSRSAENVVAYNRRVIDEWGFEDPAELYYNDEWTWDAYYDMCVEFSDPNEDRYALDGYHLCIGLLHSVGQNIVAYDTEQKKFVTHLDDPRIERAADVMYDLAKNECVYPRWKNGGAIRNNTEGAGIKEGLALFYIRASWVFTGTVEEISGIFGDVTQNEVMFVPLPRDPDGDGFYYTESIPNGFCIVNGAENPEGVALLASCDRFKTLDPTVVSIDRRQLEEKYLWTQEMLTMWDTCKEIANSHSVLVAYSAGLGTQLHGVVNTIEGFGVSDDPYTWAQLKERYSEQIEYYTDELNTSIEEFVAGKAA